MDNNGRGFEGVLVGRDWRIINGFHRVLDFTVEFVDVVLEVEQHFRTLWDAEIRPLNEKFSFCPVEKYIVYIGVHLAQSFVLTCVNL